VDLSSDSGLSGPTDGDYILQYSPFFHGPDILRRAESLLRKVPKRGDHRIIIHDANSLPIAVSAFLSEKLYLRPRSLLRGLLPDRETRERDAALRRLTDCGVRFVVFSEGQKSRLPVGARRSTIVVPHFIEEPKHSFDAQESKSRLGFTGKTVLTILGWLNPRKQCEVAVDALAHLPEEFHLVLAGGALRDLPEYGDVLKARAQAAGVASRVHITGYLDDEEQARYIAATDLALCLFRKVSASGSLSTWIAHGRPVLATRIPELEEYNRQVRDALTWCKSLEPAAVAEAIAGSCRGDLAASAARVQKLREGLDVASVWQRIRE
jgi:glycosyltransferase involved in cell wall biosynthesis